MVLGLSPRQVSTEASVCPDSLRVSFSELQAHGTSFLMIVPGLLSRWRG